MRFVVIRHGQSTNNLLWETTGSEAGRHPDTPLTDTGHQQAALLAERIKGVLPWRIDAIYTSLMARAVQTGAPVAASHRRTSPVPPPVARVRPSGLKATASE